jgi:hypothetical protein
VLGLVGNIRTEVTADNAMPGGVVLLVEFLLDESCNVLFNVELFESLGRDVDSVLLHIFGHVCILHNCFAICHSNFKKINYYLNERSIESYSFVYT